MLASFQKDPRTAPERLQRLWHHQCADCGEESAVCKRPQINHDIDVVSSEMDVLRARNGVLSYLDVRGQRFPLTAHGGRRMCLDTTSTSHIAHQKKYVP
jgi:hypothetical protein